MARTRDLPPLTEAQQEWVVRRLHLAKQEARRFYMLAGGHTNRDWGRIVSNAYLALCLVARQLPAEAPPGLVCVAVRRRLIDVSRAEDGLWLGRSGPRPKRPETVSLDARPQWLGNLPGAAEPTPEWLLREGFEKYLRGLPERTRRAFWLYFGEGLTMHEVGQAMGVSENRISQLFSQSVEELLNQFRPASGNK
jgi:RNA polymerase sigma factor (sigma-70 family)